MECPYCKSERVHRVRRSKGLDTLLAWFGRWPYCCRECSGGFRANLRRSPEVPSDRAPRVDRRAAAGKIIDCERLGTKAGIPVFGAGQAQFMSDWALS